MQLAGNRPDLFTSHLVFSLSTSVREHKFLVVECKAPGQEGAASIWTEGLTQLNNYLASIAHNSNKPKFGAIAVGKVVKFYRWDKNNGVARNMAGDDTYFYLDRQCRSVMRYLTHFRGNHF